MEFIPELFLTFSHREDFFEKKTKLSAYSIAIQFKQTRDMLDAQKQQQEQ